MQLDVQTVLVMGMITSGLVAIVLGSSREGARAPGFREATLGAVAGFFSFLALLSRGSAPDLFSVVLGNALLFFCIALYLRAYQLFNALRSRHTWAVPVAALASLLFAGAWVAGAGYEQRSIIVSSVIILFTVASAWELARKDGLARERSRGIGVAICLLTAVTQGARILLLLAAGPDTDGNLLAASLERSFAFFPAVLYAFGTGFGFVMMHNERNYARSIALAHSDPLTGCPNRRALESTVKREAAGMRRSGRPLALIVLDIDGFKQINDRQGHDVGDLVIVALAELLQGQVRGADMVARYGGEEFCILLPDTDATGAATQAERLRLAVQEHRFPHGASMTASFGIAAGAGGEAFDWRDCFRRADVALYQAKREGRNRVVIAAPASKADAPSGPEVPLSRAGAT